MKRPTPIRPQRRARKSRGFSLVELLIATVILLVGLVGIAQLVPASILINQKSRLDSTSLVFAQQQLDQMLVHPLTDTFFLRPNGAACQGTTCSLGDNSSAGLQGNALVWVFNRPLIDYNAAPVDNFSFTYSADPTDPSALTYDVRWAVVDTFSGSSVTGKRFFVGVRQLNGSTFVPPVTLDAAVTQ